MHTTYVNTFTHDIGGTAQKMFTDGDLQPSWSITFWYNDCFKARSGLCKYLL